MERIYFSRGSDCGIVRLISRQWCGNWRELFQVEKERVSDRDRIVFGFSRLNVRLYMRPTDEDTIHIFTTAECSYPSFILRVYLSFGSRYVRAIRGGIFLI